jgi:hypothetical protein
MVEYLATNNQVIQGLAQTIRHLAALAGYAKAVGDRANRIVNILLTWHIDLKPTLSNTRQGRREVNLSAMISTSKAELIGPIELANPNIAKTIAQGK